MCRAERSPPKRRRHGICPASAADIDKLHVRISDVIRYNNACFWFVRVHKLSGYWLYSAGLSDGDGLDAMRVSMTRLLKILKQCIISYRSQLIIIKRCFVLDQCALRFQ